MKWSKKEKRMLSVLEIPLIKKSKKGFFYYLCFCFRSQVVYI